MKIRLTFCCCLVSVGLWAQDYDGFIVTEQDSLIKGYLVVKREPGTGNIRMIEITKDRRRKPKVYRPDNIRYYAFRKDTFALLNAFYPFEGEDYYAQGLEARIIIGRGKVKLYEAVLKDYEVSVISLPAAPTATGSPAAPVPVPRKKDYTIYILRDRANILYGVKKDRNEFIECVRRALGDDEELMSRIESRELRYNDMVDIVRLYNLR